MINYKQIKVGDLVKLKSNGPVMTIVVTSTKIVEGVPKTRHLCQWFTSQQEIREYWFNESVIEMCAVVDENLVREET